MDQVGVRFWSAVKTVSAVFLIAGLLFSSGVFSILLYMKASGKETAIFGALRRPDAGLAGNIPDVAEQAATSETIEEEQPEEEQPLPASALIDAPHVRQNPELPRGCEVTSLTMLLNYYGIEKNKMELAGEMTFDPTPIKTNGKGVIVSWGNPNVGFVGNVTGKGSGFGIYHEALFPLLEKHVQDAVDMTGEAFETLERQIARHIPVVVWTTIDYKPPAKWVEWDTPQGKFRTTFSEHSVLLVGYDETSVYINDPLSSVKNKKVDKAQFIAGWEAMGKQAITYKTANKP